MKKSYRITATTAVMFSLWAISVQAEDTSQNAVIVTATRTAQTADDALAVVTVFTRQDIERSQARSVPELLRGTPGIDISQNGPYGKTTSLFLRGTGTAHTMVLVDGIKVGSATTGTPSWEFLPITEIERIEIVRGPRSSLYGSEAVGGVIQIFTRKGQGPVLPHAEVMVGSHSTNDVNAGVSGSIGDTSFNAHAGRFATRSINSFGPAFQFGTYVDEPDHDGYDNRYGSFHVGHRFGSTAEIGFSLLHSQGNTEYDSANVPPFSVYNNEQNFIQNTLGLTLRINPLSGWQSSMQLGQHRDELFDFSASRASTPGRFNTKRRTLSWQNDFSIASSQLLTLGYDRQNEYVDSTTAYNQTSRHNDGVFGQYQARFGAHDMQMSLRHDDNQQFGGHDTGNVAYGYGISKNTRVNTSYGTGFHAPTFNDLYFPPYFGSPTSNPNLQPEESKTFELGLTSKSEIGRGGIHAFHTTISNMIALDANYVPQNLKHATIDGVETDGSVELNKWHIKGAVTLLNPRDDETDNVLQRRSRRGISLDLDRRLGEVDTGLSVLSQGARYDDSANTVRLGGYSLVNLRAVYSFARDWSLQGRIENLLNKTYQTAADYHMLGRTYYVSLAYQPGRREH